MKDIISLVKQKRKQRIVYKDQADKAYKAKWGSLKQDAEELFAALANSVKNVHELGYAVEYNPKVPVWKRTLTIDKNGKVLCIVQANTDYERKYDSDGFESQDEGDRWSILELKFGNNKSYPHHSLDRGWPEDKIQHLLEAIAEKIDEQR